MARGVAVRKALWLKHDAHFGEHPKTLRLRRLAGRQADSAECGWWRIVEGAKRYGEWTFDSQEHLEHVAGPYARYVPLYREVELLDLLTIHNADEYQAPLTGAERVARHRDLSNAVAVIPVVTPVTPREEKSRESTEDDGRADLEAYLTVRYRPPTPRQREVMDAYVMAFDVTGPQRAADLILRHPDDPIGALKADLAEFRAARVAAAQRAERPVVVRRRRTGGFTGVNAEIQKMLAGQYAEDRKRRHDLGEHATNPDQECRQCQEAA